MRTGIKLASLVLVGILCLPGLSASDASSRHPRKAKKQEVAPLPSGPTGPVPQLPLDSTPAVAPQVSYRGGQLTILAPNSSLGDILRAVRKQTGAEMEIPTTATERVVTQLGPGPVREVIAELLNGSRFNYVLLGSPSDANVLTRVVLVAKTGGDVPGQNGQPQQSPADQAAILAEPLQQDTANAQPDTAEAEATDDNPADDNNADQNAAEAEQPPANPDQQGVKTPQQMLQEMQQRQLQLQQQQPQGQPIPGVGYPPQRPQPQQQ